MAVTPRPAAIKATGRDQIGSRGRICGNGSKDWNKSSFKFKIRAEIELNLPRKITPFCKPYFTRFWRLCKFRLTMRVYAGMHENLLRQFSNV